jgi:hypothetical protein
MSMAAPTGRDRPSMSLAGACVDVPASIAGAEASK